MILEAPPVKRHSVQLLTTHFQFSGQLEATGSVFNFINDTVRNSFSLYDAHLSPLTPGGPLKGISHSQVVIRKYKIALLYFIEAETRDSIRLFPRRELLVAHTPLAVCRGYFHMSTEANVDDFLDITPGEFMPATDVQVFPLTELPAPFPSEADLLLIGRSHLQFYHSE